MTLVLWLDNRNHKKNKNKNKNNKNNKNIDHILIIGEGSAQGLDGTTLTAKAKYYINFRQPIKRFALSLHYNGRNILLLFNATKVYEFKAKDSELNKIV